MRTSIKENSESSKEEKVEPFPVQNRNARAKTLGAAPQHMNSKDSSENYKSGQRNPKSKHQKPKVDIVVHDKTID